MELPLETFHLDSYLAQTAVERKEISPALDKFRLFTTRGGEIEQGQFALHGLPRETTGTSLSGIKVSNKSAGKQSRLAPIRPFFAPPKGEPPITHWAEITFYVSFIPNIRNAYYCFCPGINISVDASRPIKIALMKRYSPGVRQNDLGNACFTWKNTSFRSKPNYSRYLQSGIF